MVVARDDRSFFDPNEVAEQLLSCIRLLKLIMILNACVHAGLGSRHSMYHGQDLDTRLSNPFFGIEMLDRA